MGCVFQTLPVPCHSLWDGSLGWISHLAHPWRVQPRVNCGVTPLMSHRPFPAPASREQEPVAPWIPRSLSCSGWNPSPTGGMEQVPLILGSLGSCRVPRKPWNVELDLPSRVSEHFQLFQLCLHASSPTPCVLGKGLGWEQDPWQPGMQHSMSNPPGILVVGMGCCFPGKRPSFSSHPV